MTSSRTRRQVRFLRRMPPLPPRAWADSLPGGAPGGLDLLDQLLRWDPADRLSASSARHRAGSRPPRDAAPHDAPRRTSVGPPPPLDFAARDPGRSGAAAALSV